MAAIRRSAPWLGLGTLFPACVTILWMGGPAHSAPAAMRAALFVFDDYAPLDEVAAFRIEQLRNDAGLDDDALAAANLSSQQLEAVLAALRSWYEGNTAGFVSATSAITDQRALLRECQSAVQSGRTPPAEIATVNLALAQATASYTATLSGLRANVLAGLSEGQRAVADRTFANKGQSLPQRVMSLSQEQRTNLRRIEASFRQRIAVLAGSDRDQAQSDYGTAMASAMGQDNATLASALAGYRGGAAARVLAAVQKVLPTDSGG